MPESSVIYGCPRVTSASISRPQLYRRLGDSRPLVVVRGPAGIGKTTLLACWSQNLQGHHGIWIDAEITVSSFWGDLVSLIQESGYAQPGGMFAAGPAVLAPEATERLAQLIRGIRQLGPIVIVIDNAHLLAPQDVDWVIEVVRAVRSVKVVVATRTKMLWESVGVGLQVDVDVIDPHELALSRDEVGQITGLTGEALERVYTLSEGNGLFARSLGLEELSGGTVSLSESVGPQVRRLVASLSPGLRSFITATVAADELTVALAFELARVPDVEQHLSGIERVGLGMWRDNSRCFTYSSSVRRVLRGDLERDQPAEFRRLREIVYTWALAEGRGIDALRIAVDLDDLELAERAIRLQFIDLVSGANYAVTLELLSRYDEEALRPWPIINTAIAAAYRFTHGDRSRARPYFLAAAHSAPLAMKRAQPIERAYLLSINNLVAREQGTLTRAIADRLHRHLNSLTPQDRSENLGNLTVMYCYLGISYLLLGHAKTAIECFGEGLNWGWDAGSADAVMRPLSLLAMSRAMMGDIRGAREGLARIRAQRFPAELLERTVGVPYQLAATAVAFNDHDLDAAMRHLSVVEARLPATEFWWYYAMLYANALLMQGQPNQAVAELDRLIAEYGGGRELEPEARTQLVRSRSVLLLMISDPAGAIETVTSSGSAVEQRIIRGLIAMLSNQDDEAISFLSMADSVDDADATRRITRLMILAVAVVRRGDDEAAIAVVQQLGRLLRQFDSQLPLMIVPPEDRKALVALANRIGDTTTAGLLGKTFTLPTVTSPIRPVPKLTPRERTVLAELALPGTSADIAERLHVSVNTVHTQLRSLYRKLGVTSREDALRAAVSHGLISTGAPTLAAHT